MGKSSQRMFLVKVQGIDEYFATKTGGDIQSATSKAYDGGSLNPDIITAPPEADNVVCGRNYDVDRDAPVIKRLKPLVGSWTTTISVTPTDANLVAVAEPTTYPNATLVRLAEPEVDASSGDGATLELEFAIPSYT